jgi:NAD(P)-dependent dehydrogenase (short-subunit alcohol dehydrogenase family)
MPEAPLRFEGRTALITGASGAIGKAIALALVAEGARTGLVGRRLGALQRVGLGVPRGRPAPVCYPADVTSDEDLARLASEVARDLENLDVLVNSAGTFAMGRVECMDTATFDAQYRINLRAPYALARAFLPLLRKSRGQIVFINSSLGLAAKAGVAQYAATKHGLKAIAEGLREEVNRDGIRVLSVFLGRTAGEMQRGIHAYEGRAYNGELLIQPRDVACVVLAALSLDRTAEVTDITIRPLAPPVPAAEPASGAAYHHAGIHDEGVA